MKKAINLKSKSGIHRLITSLEERGFIKRLKHKARAMEIIKSLNFTHEKNNKSENNFINIPLIGYIAAGSPIEAIESTEESIPVPNSLVSSNHKYFGLKIKGLSMIDEGIFDGDIAIIKKTNIVQNGKIAAVLTVENEITLKKIRYDQSKIYLIPANKNYETREYNLGEIQVQGSLSGLIRKYN